MNIDIAAAAEKVRLVDPCRICLEGGEDGSQAPSRLRRDRLQLEALYRLNPIVELEMRFDVTDDCPRCEVEDNLQEVEAKTRGEHAQGRHLLEQLRTCTPRVSETSPGHRRH